jgi:hypothetical protein
MTQTEEARGSFSWCPVHFGARLTILLHILQKQHIVSEKEAYAEADDLVNCCVNGFAVTSVPVSGACSFLRSVSRQRKKPGT